MISINKNDININNLNYTNYISECEIYQWKESKFFGNSSARIS